MQYGESCEEITPVEGKRPYRISVPLAVTLAACHFGALGALLALGIKLADNYLPNSLLQAFPSFDFIGWFRAIMKALGVLLEILAFPAILLEPLLDRIRSSTRIVLAAVGIGNSLLWGFGLEEILRAIRRGKKPKATQDKGPGKKDHPASASFLGFSGKGSALAALAYLSGMLLLGPVRWRWGYQIMTDLGGNPHWIMQSLSTTWCRGALVEMILNMFFFLVPPALAIILYRRSRKAAVFAVVSWFACIIFTAFVV